MHPLVVITEARTEVKKAQAGAPAIHKGDIQKKMTSKKANTCDLCTQLSTPSCVYACPHDAAKRVDPQRFFGDAWPGQVDLIGGGWSPARHYQTHHTH